MNSLATFAATALVLFAFGQALAAKGAEPPANVVHTGADHLVASEGRSSLSPNLGADYRSR